MRNERTAMKTKFSGSENVSDVLGRRFQRWRDRPLGKGRGVNRYLEGMRRTRLLDCSSTECQDRWHSTLERACFVSSPFVGQKGWPASTYLVRQAKDGSTRRSLRAGPGYCRQV